MPIYGAAQFQGQLYFIQIMNYKESAIVRFNPHLIFVLNSFFTSI